MCAPALPAGAYVTGLSAESAWRTRRRHQWAGPPPPPPRLTAPRSHMTPPPAPRAPHPRVQTGRGPTFLCHLPTCARAGSSTPPPALSRLDPLPALRCTTYAPLGSDLALQHNLEIVLSTVWCESTEACVCAGPRGAARRCVDRRNRCPRPTARSTDTQRRSYLS